MKKMLVLLACLLALATGATAQEQLTFSNLPGSLGSNPHVSVSPTSGPPTTQTLVSGSGFTPHLPIVIYFDSTNEGSLTTDASGNFSNVAMTVPASALPGEHFVRAIPRAGGNGAQTQFLVNTDWSQFGFDPRHSRLNPYENVLNKITVRDMDLLWNIAAGGITFSEVDVDNGVVYGTSQSGNIYARNASTGEYLWNFFPGGESMAVGTPTVVNGVVYFTSSGNGKVYALNASTGSEIWSASVSNQQGSRILVSSPTVANGRLFIGSYDGNVYALSALDGTSLWTYPTGGVVSSTPAVANGVADGVVYVAASNGYVYALTADAGSLIWRSYNSGFGESNASPAVVNGIAYMGSYDHNLYALSVQDGHQLWMYPTGAPVNSSPAVANGLAYVSSEDNKVYALNASTGAFQWSYTTGGQVISSPTVANDVVYFGSDDQNVYALNALTGAFRWSYSTNGAVYAAPAVANGIVYIGSADGYLYAFGLTTQP